MLATSKAFPTEVAERAASNAIQILGARGYSQDHPVERAYRDAKQLQIVEGTNQIQRLIMGRSVDRPGTSGSAAGTARPSRSHDRALAAASWPGWSRGSPSPQRRPRRRWGPSWTATPPRPRSPRS